MTIYDNAKEHKASNINAYLMDAPNVFVESKSKPLCRVPSIRKGNQPTDGGNFFLSETQRNELIQEHPEATLYVKQFMGADEFINNKKR